LNEKPNLVFYKYQALGNDFVIVDGREFPLKSPLKFAKRVCDRRFSVGCDDLLYLEASKTANVKMRICEPDGSESSMCGNGIRCVALYLTDKGMPKIVSVETLGGVKVVEQVGKNRFKVDMGNMQKIGQFIFPPSERIVEERNLEIGHFYVVCPSEPHAVVIVPNVSEINISEAVEVSKKFDLFPYGINVDFLELGENAIKVRTFERGIWGETYACGTGAVASAFVASNFFGTPREINVKMKGGELTVSESAETIYLTGIASFVFKGEMHYEEY
jgi:diaminopimelate epimerase